jgi:hypothetical protein
LGFTTAGGVAQITPGMPATSSAGARVAAGVAIAANGLYFSPAPINVSVNVTGLLAVEFVVTAYTSETLEHRRRVQRAGCIWHHLRERRERSGFHGVLY